MLSPAVKKPRSRVSAPPTSPPTLVHSTKNCCFKEHMFWDYANLIENPCVSGKYWPQAEGSGREKENHWNGKVGKIFNPWKSSYFEHLQLLSPKAHLKICGPGPPQSSLRTIMKHGMLNIWKDMTISHLVVARHYLSSVSLFTTSISGWGAWRTTWPRLTLPSKRRKKMRMSRFEMFSFWKESFSSS